MRVDKVIIFAFFNSFHEFFRKGDGKVEVDKFPFLLFCADEFHDVGVVDAQNAHIRAAAGAALFDLFRSCVENT